MADGYIKLYRKMLDWEWIDDPNVLCVYVHLLLRACFKEYQWHGKTLLPGQLVAGRRELAVASGLSEQQVRTALDKLQRTSSIITESTKSGSTITIVKWADFQSCVDDINQETTDDQPRDNQESTNEQPTTNQQITTREEYKEGEERKECKENNIMSPQKPKPLKFVPPTVEEVTAYCREKNSTVDPVKFFSYYESNGWKVGRNPMKSWKASITTWERNDRDNGTRAMGGRAAGNTAKDTAGTPESFYAGLYVGEV